MSFDLRKYLKENKLTKASKVLVETLMVNGKEVDRRSVEIDGVDPRDYPDFADAYISYAEFIDGTPLSDEELDELSYDGYAQELAYDSLFEVRKRARSKQTTTFLKEGLEDRIKMVPADLAKPHGADTVLLSNDELKDRVDNILANPKDLEPLKAELAAAIQGSRIRSKDKMLAALEGIRTPMNLMKWFYNSILAKGGLRSPDSGSIREELDLEETLDDQPVDRDPTDGRGMDSSFDPSKYESVEELMREIEHGANKAALQEKMKRVKAACESLEQKATALEEGEDSKYISSAKLKEMKRSAKSLRKMYEKYEKEYDKKYNEQMKPKSKK